MCVAFSSPATPAEHELCVRLVKVCKRFKCSQIERSLLACFFGSGICHVRMKLLGKAENHRPHGYLHRQRFSVASVFVLALPVRAPARPQVRFIIQAHEVVGMNVGLENDIPSVASIATIRPAMRDVFLPAETAATVASIAGLRMNADMIDESHFAIKTA
jgi:hypothetical protein